MSRDRVRPDPDELLARVQAEEERRISGKLKIFLGYAAGVGKTYTMLEAARERRSEGVDVVIALVETHGRAETEALAAGLESVPRKRIEYRGTSLTEMDIDAVLARRPQLALVDELAHTDAPGSRHPKRYQDVEELLAAGIDVYTTLNIQHIESLKDVVNQVTGTIIRETVPDRIIDAADEIELVDLPAEDLLQRLQEGKVYVPDQAARAIQRFFRPGNLTALREMALRRTAERVDDEMRAYMETRAIPGPWPASERLLVCVSSSPLGERLVRATRRLADELNAEWFAVYVETTEHARLSSAHQDQVARTLRLAEELGAKSNILSGQAVPETVLEYAHKHNVTKIVIGQPPHSRWANLWHGAVVDDLIRQSEDIDVYVISGESKTARIAGTPTRRSYSSWRNYLISAVLVAIATGLGFPIQQILSTPNLVMFYLAAVVMAALYLGRGPSVFAAVLSVLVLDFFFVMPLYTFVVADVEFLLTLVGLFVVGLVISGLVSRTREQAEVARRRQVQTAELYEFSRDLASATALEEIARFLVIHLGENFSREVAVLLPRDGTLTSVARTPGMMLGENDLAVATWCFQHQQAAGRGTDTLPGASVRCLPLRAARGVVGVLAVKPPTSTGTLTPEQRRQLETFASQAALAIERAQFAEAAQQVQLVQATEKLQTALLNSISHDLRTPLASITGILSSLNDEAKLDEATRRSLLETAQEEAERLNRLMGNLLDMTRLESGTMKVAKQPADVQDLVGSALEQLANRLRDREVVVKVPGDLPLVPMDFVLIAQVLVNLLDNALKYSPADRPVEVQARAVGDEMHIEVRDRGVGIPPDDLERIFDKFYRVQHPGRVSGTGLGLSICKGIVEAHGGHIWAGNRDGGGAIFTVALPLGALGGNSDERT